MSEKKIYFNNASEARDVGELLQSLIHKIPTAGNIQLHRRDLMLKIEGEETACEKFSQFVKSLCEARNHISINEQSLLYAYQEFEKGEESIFQKLASIRISVSSRKSSIFPKTLGQQIYLNAIEQNDITFGIGPAGTGKTYLAMAKAVSALLQEEVSRIILTRPAIEAGENLGYLPGDFQQKVFPYLRPLYDALHDMLPAETIENFIERGIIEVAPLAYMRGRTLNHAFIILDEAQNTTPQQMLMFLTRLGFDAKCVITGDPTQIDLPNAHTSGLIEAHSILQNIQGLEFVELTERDVIRHPLVQKVIHAYQTNRSKKSS